MRIPIRKSELLKKHDNGPVYLTEAGYAKLQYKLARIKASLPALIAETAQAAAEGDRSDNAAYQTSKAALRRANWQVLEIEDELKRASVITPGPNAEGGIKMGSRVTLKTAAGKVIYEIVGPKETNPTIGRISALSPLGAALIGKKQGAIVALTTGKGPASYEIIEIQ